MASWVNMPGIRLFQTWMPREHAISTQTQETQGLSCIRKRFRDKVPLRRHGTLLSQDKWFVAMGSIFFPSVPSFRVECYLIRSSITLGPTLRILLLLDFILNTSIVDGESGSLSDGGDPLKHASTQLQFDIVLATVTWGTNSSKSRPTRFMVMLYRQR